MHILITKIGGNQLSMALKLGPLRLNRPKCSTVKKFHIRGCLLVTMNLPVAAGLEGPAISDIRVIHVTFTK